MTKMEHVQNKHNPNICLSGGADGADLEWGSCATAAGHDVIHWSFPGHRTRAPADQIIRLSDKDLDVATDALNSAARTLEKSPPTRPIISRLTRRNYYQVAWSASCYAVTVIQDTTDEAAKRKIGGTAWATTIFAQMHPENREMYLFDQEKDGWFRWDPDSQGWVAMPAGESPPRPRGIWAGIGSRDLRENGRDAIRRLMGVDGGRGV
jgi:hypothetical protein